MSSSRFSVTIEGVDPGLILGIGSPGCLTGRADALRDLLEVLLRRVPSLELLLGWCVKGSEVLRCQSVGTTIRTIVGSLSVTVIRYHGFMGGLTTWQIGTESL